MGLGINDDVVDPVRTTGKFDPYPELSFNNSINYYFLQNIHMHYFYKPWFTEIKYVSEVWTFSEDINKCNNVI